MSTQDKVCSDLKLNSERSHQSRNFTFMCVLRICLRIFDFYNVSSCTIIQISNPTNWSAEQVSLFQFPKSFKINKLNNLPLRYVNG